MMLRRARTSAWMAHAIAPCRRCSAAVVAGWRGRLVVPLPAASTRPPPGIAATTAAGTAA